MTEYVDRVSTAPCLRNTRIEWTMTGKAAKIAVHGMAATANENAGASRNLRDRNRRIQVVIVDEEFPYPLNSGTWLSPFRPHSRQGELGLGTACGGPNEAVE